MGLNHEERVIAGVLPARRLNLLHLIQNLSNDHFRQTLYRDLFTMVNRYFDVSGGVLPLDLLTDLLARSNVEAARGLTYIEAYRACHALEVSDEEFRYSVAALKDDRAKQLTGEAIATAYEILERGIEVKGEELRGHEDARTYLNSQVADIEKMEALQETPEGDMFHDKRDVVREYIDAQQRKSGIMTGIDALDLATGGFQKGELGLITAFTNAGKSNLCAQIAWHASVMQGKNVFFATSETTRSVVRRRVLARHSASAKFGLSRPLNSRDIRDGTLGKGELEVFKEVLHDLDTNPDYGRLYLAQVPRGATLNYFENRMRRAATEWHVDLAVMDYFGLLKSDRKRESPREELNDILKDAKVFAQSFHNGEGVPLLSPWQIRRESYQEALRTGAYSLSSLSDTSEAEKSPDQIYALLRQPGSNSELTIQVLKMRDAEVPDPLTVYIDLRAALFRSKATSFGGPGGGFGTVNLGASPDLPTY